MLLYTLLQPSQSSRLWRGGAMVMALAVLIVGVELKQVSWTTPVGAPKSVALVQGNIPQDLRWLEEHRAQILETYWRLSQELWGNDLIIWPESAVPLPLPYAKNLLADLDITGKYTGSALILGIPELATKDGHTGFYNSLLAVGEQASGHYAKRHLVPFGEYVPLESWLRGIIAFFDLPMSAFLAGGNDQPLLRAHGLKLQPVICYEVAYPHLVLTGIAAANVIITVSNDTWFGHSFGPSQHLQMAQFRALETGRPLLRGTNNGITAIIDAKGRVVKAAPSFEQAVLVGSIQGYQGLTPYVWLATHWVYK